jgi:hypothetical protein
VRRHRSNLRSQTADSTQRDRSPQLLQRRLPVRGILDQVCGFAHGNGQLVHYSYPNQSIRHRSGLRYRRHRNSFWIRHAGYDLDGLILFRCVYIRFLLTARRDFCCAIKRFYQQQLHISFQHRCQWLDDTIDDERFPYSRTK